MTDELHAYSEIFYSIQGEGMFTGRPTAWLRLFNCNLQCNGFGQKDPTDPSTYKLPYLEFDETSVDKVEDLPVWQFGCDSSYSWSKKFQHLAAKETGREIARKILDVLPRHTFHDDRIHMCFTGGEPLLPKNQRAVIDVMNALFDRRDVPSHITFETNGTRDLTPEMKHRLDQHNYNKGLVLFSVSPKLWSVAGEKASKAIKPQNIETYDEYGLVQLKFVMGKEQRQWDELEETLNLFEQYVPNIRLNTWVMPVGATEESQLDIAGEVADMALARGLCVSARVHCYLWGNRVGV
jgi:7-carboxy-7-deazaguanine synthase